LLLEGDLDNPGVSSTLSLEMPMFTGVSQQLGISLRGGAPRPLTVLRCSPSFHVLAEGVLRSPGLVLSVVFETVVFTLRRYFDVIVIDGPPATTSMELRAIDGLVDAVVYADPGLDSSDDTMPRVPTPAICALFSDKRLLVSVSA
jgi:Mrp family chromosome partitioning ATPase